MKSIIIFLIALFATSLACEKTAPKELSNLQRQIGFNFADRKPSNPDGDLGAQSHLFVHKYPLPADGFITGIAYLNDSDEAPENITLLILRPANGEWKVIHRVDFSADDSPAAKTGMTISMFGVPLAVKQGDMFAHWQADQTGPIPLNLENSAFDGSSFGQFGFSTEEIEEGRIISNQNFSGGRDYFINLIFEETP